MKSPKINLGNKVLKLPQNFNQEIKVLTKLGVNSWVKIKNLKNEEILRIVQNTLATKRNLERLRCIAILICELEISQEIAALLMHSGISSTKALATLNPQELFQKTGRLERILQTGRKPLIDLNKANFLIKQAKNRQNHN